jgi:hypothetical protein
MKIKDLLFERATSILYHYTGSTDAAQILKSGVFQLSSTVGVSSEEKWSPKDSPYFLSCTRSKVGDYHRWVPGGGVIFVLNGDWLNQHYKTKPIDYWERMWNHPGTDRTREAEDRVFSRNPTMPIDGVIAVHAFIKEQNEWRSPATRQLLIAAKTKGIKTYLYTDEKAWRLQDMRKAITPAQAAEFLKGHEVSRKSYSTHDYLSPWLELIHQTKQSELGEEANKLRYNLVYYNRGDTTSDQQLGTNLGNARKPNASDRDSAVKLIRYLQKHNLNTFQLANAMYTKWKKIGDEQRERNLQLPNQTT